MAALTMSAPAEISAPAGMSAEAARTTSSTVRSVERTSAPAAAPPAAAPRAAAPRAAGSLRPVRAPGAASHARARSSSRRSSRDTRSSVRPRLRLTTRGRLLLLALLVAFTFLLLSLGRGATGQASTEPPNGPVARSVVVQPGQSLWSLARQLDPAADPREVVARLRDMNALSSDRLAAGQTLLVPLRG